MAKVKSIEEIDIVMPDKVIATIEEIKANDEAAHKSLFEYVMTGKGQEEFLKQMERNQILVKARADKTTEVPEVKKALEAANGSTRTLGFDSYSVACCILETCLGTNPKGSYLA